MSNRRWIIVVTFLMFLMILPLQSQDLTNDTVVQLAWSYDSRYLAMGYYSERIDIVDMLSGSTVNQIFPTNYESVTGLAWSPNSQFLASGSPDGSVDIWDPLSGSLLVSIPDLPSDYASLLAWGPTSQFLVIKHDSSSGAEYDLNVWDIGLSDFAYRGDTPTATDIMWSPDGSRIAIAMASESIMLLDSSNFNQIGHAALDPYDFTSVGNGSVREIAWHPDSDSDLIAYGTNSGKVIIWDIAGQIGIVTLSGNESNVSPEIDELWFSADGLTLSSVSENGTLRIWNTETRQVLANSQLSAQFILDAAVSPNNKILAMSMYESAGVLINSFPTANASPDQTVTDSDTSGSEIVTLDGSASTDTDGTIVSYSWLENGVEIATGVSPQVDLAVGTHTITLVVTDDDGATGVDEVIITVEAPSTSCNITIPAADTTSLIAAITSANGAGTPQTLCLTNSIYKLDTVPTITGDITILGDGATIEFATGGFTVAADGKLTLRDVNVETQ